MKIFENDLKFLEEKNYFCIFVQDKILYICPTWVALLIEWRNRKKYHQNETFCILHNHTYSWKFWDQLPLYKLIRDSRGSLSTLRIGIAIWITTLVRYYIPKVERISKKFDKIYLHLSCWSFFKWCFFVLCRFQSTERY